MTWGDIISNAGHEDYARIRCFRHELAGATHDFTAPLFSAGTRILRKRYQTLRGEYSEEALAKMPIVSQSRDPCKAMTLDGLTQHSRTRLHTIMSCVIPEEIIEVDDDSAITMPDGRAQYTFTPETTRQRVGHVGEYRLGPEEEVIIKCYHGVTGLASARDINEDGTLRRKTRKKGTGGE